MHRAHYYLYMPHLNVLETVSKYTHIYILVFDVVACFRYPEDYYLHIVKKLQNCTWVRRPEESAKFR